MSLLDDVSIVVTPNGYKAGELYAVIPVPTEGAELVTNGDFATDSNWTKGTGWTISSGSANCDGLTAGATLIQLSILEVGKRYKLTFDIINYTSGVLILPSYYYQAEVNFNANGSYEVYVIPKFTNLVFYSNLFIGSIDNVSVKEYTSADMDVTRATAATRVDENGLVNYAEIIGGEEVINGDYTEAGVGNVISQSGGVLVNDSNRLKMTSDTSSGYSRGVWATGGSAGDTFVIEADIISTSGSVRFYDQSNNATYTDVVAGSNYKKYIVLGSSSDNLGFGGNNDTSFELILDNVSVKQVTRDNVPRIDYTGGGCPHILAEPQRTNLYPYSSDFTQWDNQNTTISSNLVTSPDGTENASEILETAVNGNHGRYDTFNSVSGGATDYTVSMFVKKLNRRYFALQNWYGVGRGAIAFFDLDTGTLLYEFAEGTDYTVNNSKIEDYGNGWYKISTTFQIPSSAALYVGFVLADTEWTTGTSYGNPYTGDITKGAYIWGAQLEIGSYPTSYIPNFGTALGVTRNQDIFTRDGIGSLINSTEGVLFVEMAALSDDGTNKRISLSNGTNTYRIVIGYNTVNNIQIFILGAPAGTFSPSQSIDITLNSKIAVSWSSTEARFYLNGSPILVTSGDFSYSASTLTELKLEDGAGGNNFYGKVKQLQVYDTSLSDTQLAALTS